jgi:murein DD-endopeptidase MepM/ murein hydrolase activator NlpD
MTKRNRPGVFFHLLIPFFLFSAALQTAHSEAAAGYPRIPKLQSGDPVFSQYSDDVLASRMALASAKPDTPLPLRIYSYLATGDDTLIGIAARCSIPYDSIASLNRIASIKETVAGRILLLPTLPGLYLPEKAGNAFENLLLSSFDPDDPSILVFSVRETPPRLVYCLPDRTFEGTLRAFFLTPAFRFPLPDGILTSSFGIRKNPVSGRLIFHNGIDLAAPRGTPVLACADGTVDETGTSPVYGNYIIVTHDGNKQSLYGHLQTIKIELHEKIKSGRIIGTVGSTGQSTGPHLHFELHENGVPKNPAGFIKGN